MIKCIKCNKTWNLNETDIIANCNTGGKCEFIIINDSLSSPPVMQKIRTFGKALLKHLKNKAIVRTQEQINKIYDEHCSKCEFYQNEECIKCGCPVVRSARYRNKLRWESEHCPINHW